jgi:ribose/xylose/arabinose/galactoside ABC-type transport system permease subunit
MHDSFQYLGKFLITLGLIITAVGGILLLFRHTGIPFLGKLPGDIVIQRKNFTFYFPLATSIILSIVLSIILYILFGKK